jgi:hypothetical protein
MSMDIPWDSINGFAGATGIGAICVLGFFFIADGTDSNILHTLNSYASTASWGILAAIPTIAISFLVGQFAIQLGNYFAGFYYTSNNDAINTILIISKAQNDFLSQEYLNIQQAQDILCGSSFSFLILGIGAFFEIKNLKSHWKIVITCAIISLILGIILFILGMQKMHLLNQLVSAASENINSLKK